MQDFHLEAKELQATLENEGLRNCHDMYCSVNKTYCCLDETHVLLHSSPSFSVPRVGGLHTPKLKPTSHILEKLNGICASN